MRSTNFGTSYEKYIGTGIVLLSQLDPRHCIDPFYYKSRKCQLKQKNLEARFTDEICKPWLPKNRITAEISQHRWEAKSVQRHLTLEDGREYPVFEFEDDAVITIIDGVSRLEVARSSTAAGFLKTFDGRGLKSRWWVVDFLSSQDSFPNPTSPKGLHLTLRSLLCATNPECESPRLAVASHPSITANQRKDVLLSRKVVPTEAFMPLIELGQLWAQPSLGMFSDIRKTKFKEEIVNLLERVRVQYFEVTLDLNPLVVTCMDPGSIQLLQSRAPLLSSVDRAYIAAGFDSGELFPKLVDTDLREKVRRAVCKQSLIMSMQTFARDIRVLYRIHTPLAAFLGGKTSLDGSSNSSDSVRQKLETFFEGKFAQLWDCENQRSRAPTDQKLEYAKRCYQHVFLYAMRNVCEKNSIGRKQLEAFARREFQRMCCGSQDGFSGRNEATDFIQTVAPSISLPDSLDSEEVKIESRHGVRLFKQSKAHDHLYLDRLLEPCEPPLYASRPFLQRELVSIFLFGAHSIVDAPMRRPGADDVSIRSPTDTSHRLPFRNSLKDSYRHSNVEPSYLASLYGDSDANDGLGAPICHSVRFNAPGIPVDSMVASMHDIETWEQPSWRELKRTLSGADGIQSKKRQCAGNDTSPSYTSATSPVERASPIPHSLKPLPVSPHPTKRTSSSIYSRYSSLTSTPWNMCRPPVLGSEAANEYARLVLSMNPYTNSERGQNETKPSDKREALSSSPSSPRNAQKHSGDQHPIIGVVGHSTRPQFIVFQSLLVSDLSYHALPTENSIENFVQNQKTIDCTSAFWYNFGEEGRKVAATSSELIHAFRKCLFNTIWVDSKKIASTETPDRFEALVRNAGLSGL